MPTVTFPLRYRAIWNLEILTKLFAVHTGAFPERFYFLSIHA